MLNIILIVPTNFVCLTLMQREVITQRKEYDKYKETKEQRRDKETEITEAMKNRNRKQHKGE